MTGDKQLEQSLDSYIQGNKSDIISICWMLRFIIVDLINNGHLKERKSTFDFLDNFQLDSLDLGPSNANDRVLCLLHLSIYDCRSRPTRSLSCCQTLIICIPEPTRWIHLLWWVSRSVFPHLRRVPRQLDRWHAPERLCFWESAQEHHRNHILFSIWKFFRLSKWAW